MPERVSHVPDVSIKLHDSKNSRLSQSAHKAKLRDHPRTGVSVLPQTWD